MWRSRVFLTRKEIEAARRKASSRAWARRVADRLVREAEAWLKAPLAVPDGESGWPHHYFDPRYGVALEYDPTRPHEHRSPVDGHVFSGAEFDAAWIALTHRRIAATALSLALAFTLTGDPRYARAGARILADYSTRYPHAPVHGRWAGQGKVMGQSLDEARWLIDLMRAYDLLNSQGGLDGSESDRIVRMLFCEAAALLRSQTAWIPNIGCWHSAALLMVGLIAGDQELVDYALHDAQAGLTGLLVRWVADDGFWREGSFTYHFFALEAIQHAAGALRAAALPIPERERIQAMYEAPVRCAAPDLSLPALNDGWAGLTLVSAARFYEVAAGWLDTARFVPVLRRIYRQGLPSGQVRDSVEAFLFGPDDVERDPAPQATAVDEAAGAAPLLLQRSHLLASSGLGVLRRGDNYVLVKYGPHGGVHGHPDKLGIAVYGLNEMLSPDLGTSGYGIPLYHSWYRQTVSHNTVVVDETSQAPATGRIVAWVQAEEFDALTAEVQDAYPGVKLVRTVILTGEYLALFDRAVAGRPHCFDWVYHQRGRWDAGEDGLDVLDRTDAGPGRGDEAGGFAPGGETASASLGSTAGYEHLRIERRARPVGPWRVTWRTPGGRRVSLLAVDRAGMEVFLGHGPGNPATEQLPALVVRQRGQTVAWAAVLDLTGEGRVRALSLLERGEGATSAACTPDQADGGWRLRIQVDGEWVEYRIGTDGRVQRLRPMSAHDDAKR